MNTISVSIILQSSLWWIHYETCKKLNEDSAWSDKWTKKNYFLLFGLATQTVLTQQKDLLV